MWPEQRPVKPDQQFDQSRFAGPGGSHEGDGFAARNGEGDPLQGRAVRREVLEADIHELEGIQMRHGNRILRPRFRRHRHNRFEVLQRNLRLAIRIHHVTQFLQRTENEERIDEEGKELSHSDALREDQIQHQEQD